MLAHSAGRTVRCSKPPMENEGKTGASSSKCWKPWETPVQA